MIDTLDQKSSVAPLDIFEATPGLRLLVLPDAKFTVVGATADLCHFTGRSKKDLAGKSIFEAFSGQPPLWDQHALLTSLSNAVHHKSVQRTARPEEPHHAAEWSWSSTPVLNEQQEIEYIICSAETEAKKVTDRERRFYETINRSTPDLIYVFDLNYRFTYANNALLTMWGKSWEDAIGRSLLENGYEPWHADMHEREIDKVVATRQPIRGEVSFPHATLGKRIYDYIFVPVLNEHNEVEAVAGTTRDITDIRLAELNIRKSEAELQRNVTERTAELEKTVRELQRSNTNLEEFAHAASHDLKEPIRKIHFFTNQLKGQLKARMNETEAASFTRIESATRRMGQLIDDLLLYSHVAQHPRQLEDTDLDLKILNVLEDLELDIQQKNATIEVADLPVVQGYQRQLGQLFQNLISNALKYSKPDVPPRIIITAHSHEEEGRNYHVIRVADNGIGFEQEYADKIFQMFTRLHGRSEYSGTGVGLSIAKKVVENHNGFIRVESAPGKGSIFDVYLPV